MSSFRTREDIEKEFRKVINNYVEELNNVNNMCVSDISCIFIDNTTLSGKKDIKLGRIEISYKS